MKKFALLLVASAFFLSAKTEAQAQVPYVTYYQPAAVYAPPAAYAPHAVYYSPVVAAPVYQPVARVRSRYRPILGRTVTRVRYGYAPTYYSPTHYAPAPVVYAY